MKILTTFALLAAMPLSLAAGVNTIYLQDGRTFSGRFIDGNSGTVAFEDDTGKQYRFRTGEVRSITLGTEGNNQGYNDRSNINRGYNNQGNNNQSYNRNDGRNNTSRILPAGTELSVRTTTTINSKDGNDGQIYSASVDRDVSDNNGNILIPRGSPAELVIRSATGGNVRNSSNLILDVQAVSVNGQRFLIDTEDLTRTGGRQGVGANKRTGEFIGGGTALGTLLGAVAGGGKGALIGALAGAAAGAGTQVLTKGGEVRVPSETVLTFRLDQQITMNPNN